MASSEGQTDLLTGWSCIVHHPSEDPEPSELISTVDITAFSDGPHVEPAAVAAAQRSSDSDSESESGTHGSATGSCSQSDSSDSDTSSTTSTQSRTPSPEPQPEFSVTSQPTGLRLTIATVRKADASSPVADEQTVGGSREEVAPRKEKLSSSSEASSDSESDATSEHKSAKNAKCVKAEGSANATQERDESGPAKGGALARHGPVAPAVAGEKKVERKHALRRNAKDGKDAKDASSRVLRGRVRVKRKKVCAPMGFDACLDQGFFIIHLVVVLFFCAVCILLSYF